MDSLSFYSPGASPCGLTKDFKIDICCLFTKHEALKRKNKEWLDRESGERVRVVRHVYPWTVVSVSWHYKNPDKRVGLVQSGHHPQFIEN